jgi:putative endonuclease
VAWTLYIVRCRDGTLYTGITNDLARRLASHDRGVGARYTRGRGPVTLVYQEALPDQGAALRREAAVKRLSRRHKQALVAGAGGAACSAVTR